MNTLNTRSAEDNARGAAINAHCRNRVMSATYTREQQSLPRRLLDVLELGYHYDHSYVNFRKQFIALKIVGLRAHNRRLAREAMQCAADKGYTVEVTPQGTIIRIPR